MVKTDFDTIILGAGPAGVGAAVYTARAKLSTLVIGKVKESALYKAHIVSNYYGFREDISGKDLSEAAVDQAKRFGTIFEEGEVVNILKENNMFKVKIDNGKIFYSKTVIICTGTAYKISGAKGEDKLNGKGVHYCAVCDGYYYKDKKIAIVGHANHAAEEAFNMLNYTKDITIISNGLDFKFSSFLEQQVKKNNIKLLKAKIAEFEGDKFLEYVALTNGERLKFDGAFMALGLTTALSFATKLGLKTEKNYIVIDRDGKTNVEGVFAAGNCTGGNAQAAVSVGEGCNAALGVIKYLRGVESYIDYS